MNTQNNFSDSPENITVEMMKKSWSTPTFEVISKEVVQSGTVIPGKEYSTASKYS